MIGRPRKVTFSQSLTSAALNQSTEFENIVRITAVYLKASVAITETVTVTLVSPDGTNYDIVLDTKTLNGETSYIFHPSWNVIIFKGGSIKVQCTNANTTGTVYVTIHAEGGIHD
jgi:Tfp pilus assembly protein FimT